MFTRSIDAALDALTACRHRLPALRDAYSAGSAERMALEDLIASLGKADQVLFAAARPPAGSSTFDIRP